ncbi:pyridoxamine 5'-phosphate oxidase [Hypericibacter adhaerens]|uniref:Pyridoxamine 5'-phosphate oxidase n=1 Tax=Hypericibacter adhaerens TaxID=2602016 RepID=A0A5J6MU26_9PROT|nr:pyridoxamine 5'-phosphate oxidase family protein [Hypericibacter adhaerens]QEX20245.1 pyridoxamine 5'-phosphate oxidase [Hypericibacter adhaerens]
MSSAVARPAEPARGESPGTLARRLLREAVKATLATRLEAGAEEGSWPYASLVLVAADVDGTPILLLSKLAQHTHNIDTNPHVSLLVDGTEGHPDVLTGPRATLLGRARLSEDPQSKRRFVARHPSASFYAGFKDFHVYRIELDRAHLVAGFGRIDWIERDQLLLPATHCQSCSDSEEALLASVNEGRDEQQWRAIAFDPEGVDLRRGTALRRIAFDEPVADMKQARSRLKRALEGLSTEG